MPFVNLMSNNKVYDKSENDTMLVPRKDSESGTMQLILSCKQIANNMFVNPLL